MKAEEIYAAPKSALASQESIERMLAKQSIIGTVIGTFSAGIPSMLLYIIFTTYNFQIIEQFGGYITLFIVMSLLGMVVGITAQVCGNGIGLSHRLCCGAITIILVVIAHLFVDDPIGLFCSIFTSIFAIYFCKIKLTEQEKVALIQWQAQNRQ